MSAKQWRTLDGQLEGARKKILTFQSGSKGDSKVIELRPGGPLH